MTTVTEEKLKTALEELSSGYSCSQVIVRAYSNTFSLEQDLANAVACGFSGGMRIGGQCGAISGAIIILGLYSTSKTENAAEAKKHCANLLPTFWAELKTRQAHTNCLEMLGFDMRNPEELQKNAEKKKQLCAKIISDVLEVLEICMQDN